MIKERKKNGQFKGTLDDHVEGEGSGMTLRDFREDLQAVEDLRAYLKSPSGLKLRKLIVALEPMNILAGMADALDPVKMRILPKVEGDSHRDIFQRQQGWRSLSRLLVEVLPAEMSSPVAPSRREDIVRKWTSDEEE